MLLGKKSNAPKAAVVRSTILEKRMQKAFQQIVDKQNQHFNEKLQEQEFIIRKFVEEETRDQLRVLKQNGDI